MTNFCLDGLSEQIGNYENEKSTCSTEGLFKNATSSLFTLFIRKHPLHDIYKKWEKKRFIFH